MLELLAGGATGGLLGIFGALFKHGIEVFQEHKRAQANLAMLQAQYAHEAVMADKQAMLIELEAKNALALADINAQKEIDLASYESLNASFENDKATYSDAKTSPWMIAVDFLRGIIRPALTTIFSFALLGATFWLLAIMPNEILDNEVFLKETLYSLIHAVIFLAESSVGWWFAARQINRTAKN